RHEELGEALAFGERLLEHGDGAGVGRLDLTPEEEAERLLNVASARLGARREARAELADVRDGTVGVQRVRELAARDDGISVLVNGPVAPDRIERLEDDADRVAPLVTGRTRVFGAVELEPLALAQALAEPLEVERDVVRRRGDVLAQEVRPDLEPPLDDGRAARLVVRDQHRLSQHARALRGLDADEAVAARLVEPVVPCEAAIDVRIRGRQKLREAAVAPTEQRIHERARLLLLPG